MTKLKTVYPRLSVWSTSKGDIPEQQNSLITYIKSNNTLTTAQRRRSRTYEKKESRSIWKRLPCCTSMAGCCQCFVACLLAAGLILAVFLPIWFTSLRTTSTTEAMDSLIIDSTTTAMSNTTMTISFGTSTTATTIASSTSTSSTSASTSITTMSTTTTTATISNGCIGGAVYTTQLLYLSLSSTLPWTKYSFNYTAPNITSATITFALRNDPLDWYLDDISVINSSGTQLLSNNGLESGSLSSWVYCNPSNATYAGFVDNSNPHNGYYSYVDGSVNASDYLSQTFTVVPNNTYAVKFWLSADSNSSSFALVTITS